MKASVADIIVLAARLSNMKPEAIVARDRRKAIVRVRAAVVIVAHKHGHSYPVIARRVGLAEHSTAVHYTEKESIWRRHEPDFAALVDRLTEEAAKPENWFISDNVAFKPRRSRAAKPVIAPLPVIKCTVDDPDSAHRAEVAVANGSIRFGAALREAMAA